VERGGVEVEGGGVEVVDGVGLEVGEGGKECLRDDHNRLGRALRNYKAPSADS
jgi:hypothetical protein